MDNKYYSDGVVPHLDLTKNFYYQIQSESKFLILWYDIGFDSIRKLYLVQSKSGAYFIDIIDSFTKKDVIQHIHHKRIIIHIGNFENSSILEPALNFCFINPHAPNSNKIIWKFWVELLSYVLEDQNPNNWFKILFPTLWKQEYHNMIWKRERKVDEVMTK
jgi:hypothetical protein